MGNYVIIPARYGSSRFPGKPLAKICGKPMIQWVAETACTVQDIEGVYVATDDKRIFDTVRDFGGEAIMTSSNHNCGTERINEAADVLGLKDDDVILNIQGDEPMITEDMIRLLMHSLDDSAEMGTLKKLIISKEELDNPNVVKVITDRHDNAIYFSRYCIPYNRNNIEVSYYKHIGVYAYRKDFLDHYCNLQPTCLEEAESLEQLRVLENGYRIKVCETDAQTFGVDTKAQLMQVEKILRERMK